MEINSFGKAMLLLGAAIIGLGLVLMFMPQIPFLGRLPGDINFQSGNVKIFFPIVTGIVLSLLLSLILNLFLNRAH